MTTDMMRWLNCKESYDDRIKEMAKLIQPGWSVLDVGAGTMVLKSYLPEGCTYTPLDVVKRSPDTIVVDLNDAFGLDRNIGTFDCAFCSGVLEYIVNLRRFFRDVARTATWVVASYYYEYRPEFRKAHGFLNDYTSSFFEALAAHEGLVRMETKSFSELQTIYLFRSSRMK